MNSIGGKILGLLISIGLIIGGLSGNLVLRGTNSSTALVVVGFCFLVWDIITLATHNKNKQKALAAAEEFARKSEELSVSIINEDEPKLLPATREIQVNLAANPMKRATYQLFLNGQPCGEISNDNKSAVLRTDRVKNALSALNEAGVQAFYSFEVTGDAAPGRGISLSAASGTPVFMSMLKNGLTVIQP